MTPEEQGAALAVKYSQERERRHAQKVLSQMSTKFLVETMRDTAGKLEPKAEDLVREAADRLEEMTRMIRGG